MEFKIVSYDIDKTSEYYTVSITFNLMDNINVKAQTTVKSNIPVGAFNQANVATLCVVQLQKFYNAWKDKDTRLKNWETVKTNIETTINNNVVF